VSPNRSKALIKGRQFSPVMDSQAEQIGIRDLLVAGKPSVSVSKRLRQTKVVGPELMGWVLQVCREQFSRALRSQRV